jgi:hypothetical protein
MTTSNSEKRVKVTITAKDRVGREESITLMLEASTAKRLENAANNTTPDGMPDNYLRQELNELEDDTKQRMSMPVYCPGYFSRSQYRRLNDFDDFIYHKFYNYTLSIDVKW